MKIRDKSLKQNVDVASDLEYLRENLTEQHILSVYEALTTIGGTYQHNRACHMMDQYLPLSTLYGILSRAYSVANTAGAPETPELNALLADIVSFRDECLVAKRDLIPAADQMGDARLAYGVVADQLSALIKRHGG